MLRADPYWAQDSKLLRYWRNSLGDVVPTDTNEAPTSNQSWTPVTVHPVKVIRFNEKRPHHLHLVTGAVVTYRKYGEVIISEFADKDDWAAVQIRTVEENTALTEDTADRKHKWLANQQSLCDCGTSPEEYNFNGIYLPSALSILNAWREWHNLHQQSPEEYIAIFPTGIDKWSVFKGQVPHGHPIYGQEMNHETGNYE